MNYFKLWKQAENHLILNDSVKLMEKLKEDNHIKFVRVKIKSWDELTNLYRCDRDNTIYIREDDMCFLYNMKKFCGEEFEIAIKQESTDRVLFWIIDRSQSWIITEHMTNIVESNSLEINKNWPLIQITAAYTIRKMWDELYKICNKLDKKILNKIIEEEQNKSKILKAINY